MAKVLKTYPLAKFVLLAAVAGLCQQLRGTHGQFMMLAARAGPFNVTSPSFADGGTIPGPFTEYPTPNLKTNPELKWSGVPAGTKSFAVICKDMSKSPPFYHWIMVNIPKTYRELSESCKSVTGQSKCEGNLTPKIIYRKGSRKLMGSYLLQGPAAPGWDRQP